MNNKLVTARNEQETFDLLESEFGTGWFLDTEDNETVTIEFSDPEDAYRFSKMAKPLEGSKNE